MDAAAHLLRSLGLALTLATLAPPKVQAAGGTWTNLLGGSWAAADNWSGSVVADGADSTADFSMLDLTTDAAVTLDGARTIGNLLFGDKSPSHNWFLETGSGGPLTLDSAGIPAFFVSNQTATVNVSLAGTRGWTKTGAGALALNGDNGALGGDATIASGTVAAGHLRALGAGPVTVQTGATLNLAGYPVTNALTLNGGTLALATGASFPLTLTNAGTNTLAVDGNYRVLSGKLTGTGGFLLTGTNTPGLALSNPANDFQGNITIGPVAFLRVDADEVIPDTCSVTCAGSLRLEGDNRTETLAGLYGGFDIFALNSGAGVSTLRIGAGDATSAFTGVIGGHGNQNIRLVKIGAGALTLGGASGYTGGTTVSAGTLRAGGATSLGTGAVTLNDADTGARATGLLATGAVTLNHAITVDSQGAGVTTLGTDNFTSAANMQYGGVVTLQRDVTLQAGSSDRTTFANTITGTGNLTITSPFAMNRRIVFDRVSGATNDFVGNLTVSTNADLQIGVRTSIGNRTLPDRASVSFAAGGRLRIAPAAGLDGETVGALRSLTAGAGTIFKWFGTELFTLTIGAGDGSGVFSGVLQNDVGAGLLALAKTGTGTQTLNGASTYGGGTTISQGRMLVGNAAALGAGPVTLGDAGTGTNAATLLATGPLTVNNNITVAAQGRGEATIGTDSFTASANMQYGGTVTLNRDVTLAAGSSDRTTFGGLITGAGNITVASPFAGSRRIVFDRPSGATNTFAGTLTVSTNADLQIGVATGIGNRTVPDGTAIRLCPGARLRIAPVGAGDAETVGALVSLAPGAGTVDMFTGAGFTLTVGGGDGSGDFSGAIINSSGALALTKTGAGTQVLSGTNTYGGATTVAGGQLLVNGRYAGAGLHTAAGGGTLGGSGVLGAGASVADGGVLSAGGTNATAELAVQGTITFQSGGTLAVDIRGETAGAGYDRLNMTGALQPGDGTLRVTLLDGYVPRDGAVYTIVSGCSSIAGTFAGLPDGGRIVAGDYGFVVEYDVTAGAVTLTAHKVTQGTVLTVR